MLSFVYYPALAAQLSPKEVFDSYRRLHKASEPLGLLGERGITRLMVEAGPILAAAFVRADLVDEAALLRGPAVIGPDAIDALDGLPLSALTRSPRLTAVGDETIGAENDVPSTYL